MKSRARGNKHGSRRILAQFMNCWRSGLHLVRPLFYMLNQPLTIFPDKFCHTSGAAYRQLEFREGCSQDVDLGEGMQSSLLRLVLRKYVYSDIQSSLEQPQHGDWTRNSSGRLRVGLR